MCMYSPHTRYAIPKRRTARAGGSVRTSCCDVEAARPVTWPSSGRLSPMHIIKSMCVHALYRGRSAVLRLEATETAHKRRARCSVFTAPSPALCALLRRSQCRRWGSLPLRKCGCVCTTFARPVIGRVSVYARAGSGGIDRGRQILVASEDERAHPYRTHARPRGTHVILLLRLHAVHLPPVHSVVLQARGGEGNSALVSTRVLAATEVI